MDSGHHHHDVGYSNAFNSRAIRRGADNLRTSVKNKIMMKKQDMLSVVHHRIMVLAGLGVVDYVALPPLPQE